MISEIEKPEFSELLKHTHKNHKTNFDRENKAFFMRKQ